MNVPLKIGQPRFLDVDEMLALHRASADVYGGVDGLVDRGRLESALAMPTQGRAGAFAHDFPFGMAAAYGFHLAMNHPFRDGNNRAALLAMAAFLRMNGWDLVMEEPGAANVILELIEGRRSKQWLADRLTEHSRARPSLELRDFFAGITYEADLEALRSLAASNRLEELDATLADAVDSMPALHQLASQFSSHLDMGDRDRAMHAGVQIVVYLRLYRLAEDMGYEW